MTITSTYQWYRHTTSDPTASPVAISGATAKTYVTVTADVGKYLHAKETPSNAKGTGTPATSNVFGPIAAIGATFTPEAGRIAPIETIQGGRTPPDDILSYDDYVNLDAELATHNALHTAMHAAVNQTKVVASGRWSDPATWSNGLPQSAVWASPPTVHVPSGFTVTYDVESGVQIADVMVHGSLVWDITKDTKLVCDTLHTAPASYLEIGTRANPVPYSGTGGKPRVDIVFIGQAPGTSPRLGIMTMGKVSIWGTPKVEMALLQSNVSAGATQVVAKTGVDISSLKPGDRVVIPSSDGLTGSASSFPYYNIPASYYRVANESLASGNEQPATQGRGFKNAHDEYRTITQIVGQTITLDAPLTYAHVARTPVSHTWKDTTKPTIGPYITSLSRNIRFSSGGANLSDLQQRAHAMFMSCDHVDVRWAESVDMGRSLIDPTLTSPNSGGMLAGAGGSPLGNPNNVRGRYPWHIHGTGRTFGRYMAIFEGLTAYARPNQAPIPGWAFTQHNSRAAIERCVAFRSLGASFVSELGTETGQWIGNISMHTIGNGFWGDWGTAANYVENMNGGMGIAFENQSRSILMQNNFAFSAHTGYFWMPQAGESGPHRAPQQYAMRLFNPVVSMANTQQRGDNDNIGSDWFDDGYGVGQNQIPDFNDNVAVDCDEGFFVTHRRSHPYDMTPMIAKRFLCYGVGVPLFFQNYTWHYGFNQCAFWGGGNNTTAIQMGTKTQSMHFRNMIVEGYPNVFDNRSLVYGKAIDFSTDGAFPAKITPINSTSITYTAPSYAADSGSYVINPFNDQSNQTTLDANAATFIGDPMVGAVMIRGIITDAFGTWKYPAQEPDTSLDPNEPISYVLPSTIHPKQIVIRNGCFQSGGTWYCPTYHRTIDRALVDYHQFRVDLTLTNFDPAFLAAHTITPAAPALQLLPESINKPFPVVAAPTNSVLPSIAGAPVVGATLWIHRGTWSGKPNDVDYFNYSWKRGATVVANTRTYTPVAADVGQALTCDVTAYNPGGGTTVTTTARTVVAAATDLQTTFGSALKDIFRCDFQFSRRERRGSSFAKYYTAPDGPSCSFDGRLNRWYGVNGSQVLSWANEFHRPWNPLWSESGWFDKSPAMYFEGEDNRRSAIEWATTVSNPHLWLVIERPAAQWTSGNSNKHICTFGGAFGIDLYCQNAGADASQNKLFLNGTPAFTRTDFPAGRSIVYVGRGTAGRGLSVNNANLIYDGAGSGSGSFVLKIGSLVDFPLDGNFKGLVKAWALVDKPAITTAEHAAAYAYLSQRYL